MIIANYPANSSTIQIAVTSTASAAAVIPGSGSSIRICNEGPSNCYVAIGDNSVVATVPTSTAASSCTPVLSGADVVFSKQDISDTYISAITMAGNNATINVSSGEGS